MKKIIIKKETNCYSAAYFDESGNPDQDIIDAIGTHILPTAFTVNADSDEVFNFVREKNPGVLVIFDSQECLENCEKEKFYFVTIPTGKGGPGYFRIFAKSESDARKIAFDRLGKSWAFMYRSLDDIHPLDRIYLGDI